MSRASIANYIDTKTSALMSRGVTIGEIARNAGIGRDMLYQIRMNRKPASWEHALKLNAAYPSEFDPEIIAPDFFKKLRSLNFEITKLTLENSN